MTNVPPADHPDYLNDESFALQVAGPSWSEAAVPVNGEAVMTWDGSYFNGAVAWTLVTAGTFELVLEPLGVGSTPTGIFYRQITSGPVPVYLPTQHFGFGFTARARNLDNVDGAFDLTTANAYKIPYGGLTPPRSTFDGSAEHVASMGNLALLPVPQVTSYDDLDGAFYGEAAGRLSIRWDWTSIIGGGHSLIQAEEPLLTLGSAGVAFFEIPVRADQATFIVYNDDPTDEAFFSVVAHLSRRS